MTTLVIRIVDCIHYTFLQNISVISAIPIFHAIGKERIHLTSTIKSAIDASEFLYAVVNHKHDNWTGLHGCVCVCVNIMLTLYRG